MRHRIISCAQKWWVMIPLSEINPLAVNGLKVADTLSLASIVPMNNWCYVFKENLSFFHISIFPAPDAEWQKLDSRECWWHSAINTKGTLRSVEWGRWCWKRGGRRQTKNRHRGANCHAFLQVLIPGPGFSTSTVHSRTFHPSGAQPCTTQLGAGRTGEYPTPLTENPETVCHGTVSWHSPYYRTADAFPVSEITSASLVRRLA